MWRKWGGNSRQLMNTVSFALHVPNSLYSKVLVPLPCDADVVVDGVRVRAFGYRSDSDGGVTRSTPWFCVTRRPIKV